MGQTQDPNLEQFFAVPRHRKDPEKQQKIPKKSKIQKQGSAERDEESPRGWSFYQSGGNPNGINLAIVKRRTKSQGIKYHLSKKKRTTFKDSTTIKTV